MFKQLLVVITHVLCLQAKSSDNDFFVRLLATPNKEYAGVQAMGAKVYNLTEDIKKIWGITDDKVRKYLEEESLFDVDFISFTKPKEYVVQAITLRSSRVVNFGGNPTVISENRFRNNFGSNASYTTNLKEEVTNSVSSSWSGAEQFTGTFGVEVGVETGVFSAGANAQLGLSTKSGKEDGKEETLTIGTDSGVLVTLKPGETATVVIKAFKGKMQTVIKYDAFLAGDVYVKYKSNSLVSEENVDILNILFNNDLPILKRITEKLAVTFVVDNTIEVSGTQSITKELDVTSDKEPILPPNHPRFAESLATNK